MRFGSVCSGIEAASCAWEPLGWKAAFLSEIEPFPCAVLADRYPDVPNLGDMTKFKEWGNYDIDVLVGGTPCQSFSVAGLRKGLADPRGNLMLTYLAIADKYRPTWLVWENVPGVLSSNGGKDFGTLLGGMAELGYGFAYRVLDAQYVRVESHSRAVPQRRRRVFVVGHLGDWRRAAAVLFERESLCGHLAPRRQAGQVAAPTLDVRAGRSGETTFHTSGGLVAGTLNACGKAAGSATQQDAESGMLVAQTLLAKGNSSHAADIDTYVAHSLRGEGFDASEDGTGRGTPLVPIAFDWYSSESQSMPIGEACPPLKTSMQPAVAFAIQERAVSENIHAGPQGAGFQEGVAYTLEARHKTQYVANYGVRRLTPMECERLQGYRDGYTLIMVRGKLAADGPRYKALGNSMATNVMRFIGERIEMVENLNLEFA